MHVHDHVHVDVKSGSGSEVRKHHGIRWSNMPELQTPVRTLKPPV